MKPLARRDALVLQKVGDQLAVYDQKLGRLHILNRSAVLVWQHCDGHRDVAQLAEVVARELGTPADDEVVLLALQQLDEAALLKAHPQSTANADAVSRRDMMSRTLAGLAAGVFMPVVTSCGSIVDSTIGAVAQSNVGTLVVTTTTPPPISTTTSTTAPPNTTTTSTTAPPNTTTTTTTAPPFTTTTTTTTTAPPFTTTTTTTAPPFTTTTTTTVATTTTPPPRKVAMCHEGRTIMVSASSVDAHLAHGDTMGPCPN